MNKCFLAMLVLTLTGFNARAVEPGSYRTDAGLVITPMLQTALKYDDNIYSRSDNEQSSVIYTVTPTTNVLLEDGVNKYLLDLGLSYISNINHADDNKLDGNIAFSSHIEPSSLHRVDFIANADWITEARGTGLTEGQDEIINDPLRYVEQLATLSYEYGAKTAKARVAFELGYLDKRYNNHSTITRDKNYHVTLVGATLFYSTQHRFHALVEFTRDTIRYQHIDASGKSRDSDDYNILGGIRWEATALTAGTVKLGYQLKEFTDSSRDNFNGLSWDITLDWQPLTYSKVTLNTARKAKDPNVEGDYVRESLYAITWSHQWNEVLSTTLSGFYSEENFQGISRADDTKTLHASIDYSISRWADVSLFTEISDKDSTRANIDFDKNIVGLNFVFSL